jgi:hypothetical protein
LGIVVNFGFLFEFWGYLVKFLWDLADLLGRQNIEIAGSFRIK